MTKRVFIAGHYGFGNTGDEAILASIVADLRELSPGLPITIATATPESTASALATEAVLWSDSRAVFEAVREASLVIVGGGGIFHDYAGINPDTFLTDNHWGISYFTGPAMLAALHQRPVMLYAVGVGPLYSEYARQFTKAACDAAVAITVRDAGSRQILESIGVPKDRILVTADPAFSLALAKDCSPSASLSTAPLSLAPRPRIAVALRRWQAGTHPEFWERETAAGLDSFLREHGGSVCFLPFERPERALEDDLDVARRVHSFMEQADSAAVGEARLSPEQTVDMLREFDLVVGMRLHSLILGTLAKVPVLALSYDTKVDQLMQRIGLEDFNLDVRSLDAGSLASGMWRALQAKQEVALDDLAREARRNAAIAISVMDEARGNQPLEPPVAALLARGIRAQLRDLDALRRESRHLFQELEYYQAKQVSASARAGELEGERNRLVSDLAVQIAASEQKLSEAAMEKARIEADLRKEMRDAADRHRETAAGLKAEREQIDSEMALRADAAKASRIRLESEIRTLTSELASQLALQYEAAEQARLVLLDQAAQGAREREEAARRNALLDARQNELKAQIGELKAQLAVLTTETHKQRVHQSALEAELAERTASQRELAGGLREAEELRRQLVGRLNQFQNKLTADVELYRGQRAWKIMLAIRKAYTLYAQRGLLSFLKWTLALPFSGVGPLQEFELKFPDLRNYLPERLHSAQDASPALSTEPNKLRDLFPSRKYDVVILAIFDFDFRFQRPQQVAAQFARTGHRVFWVSPARFQDAASAQPYDAISIRDNIWEVRLRGKRPDLYGGEMSPSDLASYTASFKQLYQDFQISESAALLQFPYWRQLGLALRKECDAVLVYDCMDDWQNWTAEPHIGEFSLSEERKLAQEADVLVVTSEEFRERHAAAGLHPLLIRNGADYDFFANPRKNDLLPDIPKPIIGYYGAIADWFDLDLLTEVAAARPQYSFVVIGQVHQVDVSRLSALPNVHLLGEKHYREIPSFLEHFDVCLIPFKLTALTKGVDPVKLYEYLSQGKPVVATEMPELPAEAQLIHTAANANDFARKVDLALEEREDRAKETKRKAFAQSNTWARRVEDLDRSVAQQFPLVSILIVTYNCEEFIEPCLDAVAQNTSWPHYEVILVDNNSSDGTKQILEQYAREDARLRLIPSSKNLGFAGGNNVAAQVAEGEYLIFLNPDTIVTPGWMGRLIRHCRPGSEVGAVAAVTNFSGNETKVTVDYGDVAGMYRFAMDLAAANRHQSRPVDVAPLYCVAVPRAVWAEVGELDPGFEVGMFEDDDFSLRIRKAGHAVVTAEDCFIHHFGNGSFSKLAPEQSLRIFEDNRRRFENKWGQPWQPHKLRPGVRSPADEARFTPAEFLHTDGRTGMRTPEPLVVTRLHPSGTVAGKSFNTQADGASALVVECASATPNTVIVMGTTILRTSYGSGNFLSGLVPPELYARPGRRQVYLLNDFGESSAMEFEVSPEASTN